MSLKKKRKLRQRQQPINKFNYFAVSLQKGRHYKVVEYVKRHIAQIASESDRRRQRSLRSKLYRVVYFDKRENNLALLKYYKFLTIVHKTDCKDLLLKTVNDFELYALEHGTKRALEFYKDLYGLACRYATSSEYKPIAFLKSDSSGFPRCLEHLRPLLKGSMSDRRLGLGILLTIKLVDYHDYGTINLGAIGKNPINVTSQFTKGRVTVGTYFREAFNNPDIRKDLPPDFQIGRWISAYEITLNRMFPLKNQSVRLDVIKQFNKLHFSGRNGPNGPCLSTAVLDYDALEKDPKLLDEIKRLSLFMEHKQLSHLLDEFDDEVYTYSNNKDPSRRPIHSKINLKEESWGRLRPFATVDYFSHSVLRGFHAWLYARLDKLQEDCTLDQEKGVVAAKKWTTERLEVESADLSEATNAIPIFVQREIVQQIAGENFAESWSNIISNRDFTVGATGNIQRYTCGQPMGASSSWPMLAIWHHVMMRSCLTYLGKPWGKDCAPYYYVIGDDVEMLGQDLFYLYKTVVGTLQGVGISKLKGYHSDTRRTYNLLPGDDMMCTAEFAKRIICNGQNISPIPPDEVVAMVYSPIQLAEMLVSLQMRNYQISAEDIQLLAALSFDKQLALDGYALQLTAVPLVEGNTVISQAENTQTETTWSKLGIDIDTVKLRLYETVRDTIIRTLLSIVSNINRWLEAILKDGDVNVKSWVYHSEVQAVVLAHAVQGCRDALDEHLETFLKGPPKTPNDWKVFKGRLSKLQVLFDVDNLFKETLKPKEEKRKFVDNIIKRAMRTLTKEFKQQKLLDKEL